MTTKTMGVTRSITLLVLFSIAFAFVEAAVVVYLRHLLGASQPTIEKNEVLLLLPGIAFLEPRTALQIITNSAFLNIEMVREAATLVMLLAVALLAGRSVADRVAYFFLAFGVWDLFYYVFLKLTVDWPGALTDLDTFFLLPVPWIGPVFVPLLISTGLVTGALLFLLRGSKRRAPGRR